ncbi:bifunctional lysylphosphatidylglycerol flippase/synthetase MprF [Bacillus smithii]|uniref:bifunctional lysylphosphatidylglycerol flippase/synthetase MprF n=1 Tax=Bacillus smithii TaxID=1479 RepID=UPI0022E08750|nr:bifunctional lysylphosphatidylglycerol flippase/synthetase MprF [Bacillus smithii]
MQQFLTFKRLRSSAKFFFSLAIIVFVFFQGKRELSNISISDSIRLLKSLSSYQVTVVVLLGLLAVSTMFLYDFFLLRFLNLNIRTGKIFRISWIANTLNGILGFGGIIGAGLRMMLYKQHTKEESKLLRGIAWMATGTLAGLSFYCLFVLLNFFHAKPLLASKKWLDIVVVVIALYLPAFFLLSRIKGKDATSFTLSVQYMVASIIEWLSAAIVAFFSLRVLGIHVPFGTACGIFFTSAAAGLISMIPGGLGAFDVIYLIGFQELGYQEETIVSALLLYRTVYYFLPFLLGLIFTIYEFSGNVLKKPEMKPILGPAIDTSSVVLSLQKSWVQKIPYLSFSILVFLSGVYLFLYGIEPYHFDHSIAGKDYTRYIKLLFDAFLVALSITLILSVKGVYLGTKRARHFVFNSFVLALLFVLLTAGTVLEVIWLIGMILLFGYSKKKFDRIRRPVTGVRKLVLVGLFMLFYWIYFITLNSLPDYAYELGMTVQKNDVELTFGMTTAIFLILNIIFYYTFESKHNEKFEMEVSDEKLLELLHHYGGNYLSHLAFLGDKSFFLSKDGNAFIQFSIIRDKVVVLGDPVGNEDSFYSLLNDLYKKADRFGYHIIFYQVQSKYMPMYHDFGNSFFKLGEEAIVDLTSFSLRGKRKAGLRSTKNRLKRENIRFRMVEPPFTDEFFHNIEEVSNQWLGKKKEKGFSLGYFDRDYLSLAPVAVLETEEGKILAFASLMPTYQKGIISIDLMRYVPDAPPGIMDGLLIAMIEWAQEHGYTTFNLGMTPLSNVGQTETAFWPERIASHMFHHIQYIYHFAGLRKFKEKYDPNWEPRYMAYRKYRFLPFSMIDVARLINRGKPKPSSSK